MAPETPIEPGLYVAATPIGNLKDMTYRAVEILHAADLILCEDTRQTAKLCAAYEISTPRKPYHDHNGERVRPEIIKDLLDGAAICLVSDAGTPLISDPGYKLVREARDAGVKIIPLPGPTAAIAALSVAGAPTDRFFFAGFLPSKDSPREKMLRALAGIDATLVFYETAPRLSASLQAMSALFGDRQAAIARELTKLHEEVLEGSLALLAAQIRDHPVKGEIVIVVHPPSGAAASTEEIDRFLTDALARMSVKDAVATASEALGVSRKIAYARALTLKGRE